MLNTMLPSDAASMKEPYDATELGAPFKVYLTGGVYQELDQDTGKLMTCIEDPAGLLAAVIKRRVCHQRKLSGPELRFFRSSLCLKAHQVAKNLDVTVEHYSRLENGSKVMSSHTEKLYRMSVFLLLGTRDLHLAELASTVPQNEKSEEKAEEALEGIKRIFFGLRIDPFHDPDEALAFSFHFGCVSRDVPCDDEKWRQIEDKAA